LPKNINMMQARENEIARLVRLIDEKSKKFEEPKLILIGGYALRAYVPFARATRDCDFVLQKKNGWNLDEIKNWFSKDIVIEVFEKLDVSGFLRCIKTLKVDEKNVKVALDFMEGEVTGRNERDKVRIDESFVVNSKKAKIRMADEEFEVYVPRYIDYMILKIVSARPSDIRDIATMVWKKGVPKGINKRAEEIMPFPEVLVEKMKLMLLIISDARFIHSWRGTFATKEFDEKAKRAVINKLNKLI